MKIKYVGGREEQKANNIMTGSTLDPSHTKPYEIFEFQI